MNKLHEQLIDIGINRGSTVLMHSSMKALGTSLSPEDFLLEIIDVLTSEGTLLLPALTYETVTLENPCFSIKESEPCVGILPKTFMKMDGVVRSMHPTHSVFARGLNADDLTSRHIRDDTPVGAFSPFMLLPEYGGCILFVGDVLHACTFMHGLEEIVNAPYTMNKEMTEYTLKDAAGSICRKKYYTHNFKGWEQEYTRIRDILNFPDIRTGNICSAHCTLIDAAALKTAALERFKSDIYAFVSPADGE